MADVVAADSLVKWYGPRLAVKDVSFTIEEGEIVGLLGPNGSGKSTILRILTGYLPPSSGSARIAGFDVMEDSLAARASIGYLAEDAPIYSGMRVDEFLHFMARIKGLSGSRANASVAMARERLELDKVAHMAIGKLSRGYRQRVAIAQALLGDPPLLILDEPTNALDAYQVIAVRELIRSLAGQRTVLLASHVLTEIEKIASRVMILVDGMLLTTDAKGQDTNQHRFRLRIAGAPERIIAQLRKVPGVASVEPEQITEAQPVSADSETSRAYIVPVEAENPRRIAEDLAQAVIAGGFPLSELTLLQPDLEQVFLALTKRATPVS
ncbi:MAG: ABC transporter ATP-binding protein [Acetobacteraceae bacterium]|nr:ABC transporter ATP-binding protein [Acetobacteraceae bacterium]